MFFRKSTGIKLKTLKTFVIIILSSNMTVYIISVFFYFFTQNYNNFTHELSHMNCKTFTQIEPFGLIEQCRYMIKFYNIITESKASSLNFL